MSPLYVPIMAAKQGEYSALSNLQPSVSTNIFPLFELPAKKPNTKSLEKTVQRTAFNAGKVWATKHAFLDFSKWSPNTQTESGIHLLEYAFGQFRSNGVQAHPVIGYDRWDDPDYVRALKNIRHLYAVTPCIRLNREVIRDDMHDQQYFAERINEILSVLDVVPNNCYIMIDYGNVLTTAIPNIISSAEAAVELLRSLGFGIVIMVGGSMPAGINEAVNTPDTEGCIPRIEMMAWKAILADKNDSGIVFGDYLIRNPDSVEGIFSQHANAKIRYTIDNQYFIVRGHSKKIDSLAVQHRILAQKLVASPYFMGSGFSWGDSEILNCSLGSKDIRSAMAMIAIDSNHHINAIVTEVFEYQQSIMPSTAALLPIARKE